MKYDVFRTDLATGDVRLLGQVVAINEPEALELASIIHSIDRSAYRLDVQAEAVTNAKLSRKIKYRELAKQVLARGPTRVVVNADGHAVSPRRARRAGVPVDVIFVRDDGWSLGTPLEFVGVAERMWQDSWVCVLRSGKVEPYRRG